MLEWIFNNGGGFDQEARTNWSWEHWSHISPADKNIRREKNIRPNWNWGKETLISLIVSWSKYQISQKWSSNQILTSHFISWAANLKYNLDIFQKQYMCQRWNSGCRKILVGIYRLNVICIFWWNWLCDDKTLTILAVTMAQSAIGALSFCLPRCPVQLANSEDVYKCNNYKQE